MVSSDTGNSDGLSSHGNFCTNWCIAYFPAVQTYTALYKTQHDKKKTIHVSKSKIKSKTKYVKQHLIPRITSLRGYFGILSPIGIRWSVGTYEFLVFGVEGEVPERRGRGAHHPVSLYRQQVHDDRQPLLLPHLRADLLRRLKPEVKPQIQLQTGSGTGNTNNRFFTALGIVQIHLTLIMNSSIGKLSIQ